MHSAITSLCFKFQNHLKLFQLYLIDSFYIIYFKLLNPIDSHSYNILLYYNMNSQIPKSHTI
jgi:hypothetical protein